jgi:hypothetical protein
MWVMFKRRASVRGLLQDPPIVPLTRRLRFHGVPDLSPLVGEANLPHFAAR